jgi:hypothetical protein
VSQGVTFEAAFAPGRKCFQCDTDGEVTLTLVVPESEAAKVLAAFQVLRDESFSVTLNAG